jgi:CspA family cold shock protein
LVGGSNPSPGTSSGTCGAAPKITRKSERVAFSATADCARLPVLQYLGETKMPQGTVKWFNPTKGYGFIQPQEGGKDVFVHISAVERAGLNTLNEGQVVQYELVENRGKTSAENLKVK